MRSSDSGGCPMPFDLERQPSIHGFVAPGQRKVRVHEMGTVEIYGRTLEGHASIQSCRLLRYIETLPSMAEFRSRYGDPNGWLHRNEDTQTDLVVVPPGRLGDAVITAVRERNQTCYCSLEDAHEPCRCISSLGADGVPVVLKKGSFGKYTPQ